MYRIEEKIGQESKTSLENITNFCMLNSQNPNLNEIWVVSTFENMIIGSITNTDRLQKTSYTVDSKIGKIEYLKNEETLICEFVIDDTKSLIALLSLKKLRRK